MDKAMKTPTIIIVFLIQSVVLNAQHVFSSLDEVWEYSLLNNPENTIYRLKVEKANKDKITANSFLYPKVGAGFSGQKSIDIPETPVPGELVGMPGETVYMKFGQNYSYSSGISISKTILDWQSMAQAKIAKLNVSLNQAQKDYFEQTLKEQLAQVYYAAITANKAVEISNKDFEIADSLFLIAQDRFEQGLIDGLVLNQAKINKNNVIGNLEQNKFYQSQWMYNLKLLLGFEATDSLILTEDIVIDRNNDQFDYGQISNEKYTRIYNLQSDISGIETKRALSRFAPKIDIVRYYGVQQYQDDFNFSFNSSDWKQNSYLGLSLSVPIFTGFANKSQYSSAKISRTITQTKYQDEVRKSAINDSILLANYFSSIKLIEIASETYKVSGNNVELASQKYTQGLISLDEYLKVFDDYLAVENQYFNSLSTYLINKATIEARKN
jgi:outer membrane protein TolC